MYITYSYAGFWRRFAAAMIDGLVMLPVVILIYAFTINKSVSLVENFQAAGQNQAYLEYAALSLGRSYLFSNVLYFIVQWLYFSIMESSGRQATLGKLAVGIKVTDINGEKLSFGRATGRHFAKIINSFTFSIGYLMAAFTQQKQALHDLIAGTLVISKEYDTGRDQTASNRLVQTQTNVHRETGISGLQYPPAPGGAAAEVICPKCGMVNDSRAIFCACCGDELKQYTEGFGAGR